MEIQNPHKEIDLHRIIPRYIHTRVQNESVLQKLHRSIERHGQITPVLVVPDTTGNFVLIDGYMRVLAIQKCRMDTVNADICEFNEKEALIMVVRKSNERNWEAIEQALIISELIERFKMSLSDVAKEMTRDKSWVKRRLDLVRQLPEETLNAVQSGHVSPWSGSRVLAPLARANPDHARLLTKHLIDQPMSTRQLVRLYEHYKKSNREVRQRIIDNPLMFNEAEKARQQELDAQKVKNGPEGSWIKDMGLVCNILLRLCKQIETVFYQGQSKADRDELMRAFDKTKTQLELIERRISAP